MGIPHHPLTALFEQLGLGSTDQEIRDFIKQHGALPNNIPLHQANFWNPSQADFLHQSKEEDADWAEVVDQLDVMLRAKAS